MVKQQDVVIPYSPRGPQQQIHSLIDANRFTVVVAHRRMGKSVAAINECIRQAVVCPLDRPRIYYLCPTLKQAKAVVWDYLLHYSAPIPGRETNIAETRIDLPNGGRVQLVGADNPDALRGLYADFIVLDEVGMMQARTWTEIVRPMLADRQGKALFLGTPQGRNIFWELRNVADRAEPGWSLAEFRAQDTGILPQAELDDARRLMSTDEYAQEFECSFEASVRGAIYGAELEQARQDKRICRVPRDDALLVHTAWDLGIGDATSIIFWQQHASELRLIDYYEASGEGLAHYIAKLTAKQYNYGRHIAPHDIEVRELGSGKSRREQARAMGIVFDVAPKLPLEDGINAVRGAFSRFWIDSERCAPLLDGLQNYRREYNQRLDEFRPTPVHDWSSHPADALRYLVLAAKGERRWQPITYQQPAIV